MAPVALLLVLGRRAPAPSWLQTVFFSSAVQSHELFVRHPSLGLAVRMLLSSAWEPSTWSSYSSAARSFFDFCAGHGINTPLPPSAAALIGWIAFLFRVRSPALAASSISQYVTALRSACHMLDVDAVAFDSHQLRYVLRGMKKVCPRRFLTEPRLPITIWLLADIFRVMPVDHPDTVVMQAALSLGVYGLLRSAEFLAKSFNPCPLARSDVTWHSDRAELRLRYTKGDVYHTGVLVTVFRNDSLTCPYALLRLAFAKAPVQNQSAPALQKPNGEALAYKDVQKALFKYAALLGLDPKRFKLHGLRIGGATSLAILGVPAHIIKAIGRWKSICYQTYTRTSSAQFQKISQVLGQASGVAPSPDNWFGGLQGSQRYAACGWNVDDLASIAVTARSPGGGGTSVVWGH